MHLSCISVDVYYVTWYMHDHPIELVNTKQQVHKVYHKSDTKTQQSLVFESTMHLSNIMAYVVCLQSIPLSMQ